MIEATNSVRAMALAHFAERFSVPANAHASSIHGR
jgi:hypothetical protein